MSVLLLSACGTGQNETPSTVNLESTSQINNTAAATPTPTPTASPTPFSAGKCASWANTPNQDLSWQSASCGAGKTAYCFSFTAPISGTGASSKAYRFSNTFGSRLMIIADGNDNPIRMQLQLCTSYTPTNNSYDLYIDIPIAGTTATIKTLITTGQTLNQTFNYDGFAAF